MESPSEAIRDKSPIKDFAGIKSSFPLILLDLLLCAEPMKVFKRDHLTLLVGNVSHVGSRSSKLLTAAHAIERLLLPVALLMSVEFMH